MAENSKIQWTDKTWNPWHGCHKISEGCKYCYMMRDKEKYGQDGNVVVRSKTTFNDPLKWNEPALVFTCSWSDFFIEEADQYRAEAWSLIKSTPHLTYQILTKRPENIAERLPPDWGDGYPNVWLGVSVENQKRAEERIPILMRTPAKVRWLSCEPLIDHVILDRLDICYEQQFGWSNVLMGRYENNPDPNPPFGLTGSLHWIVVGGESGNDNGFYKYRPCEIGWIEDLVGSCLLYKMPVFVKQLGTHLAKGLKLKDRHGGDIDEFPVHLRVRQMPRVTMPFCNVPIGRKFYFNEHGPNKTIYKRVESNGHFCDDFGNKRMYRIMTFEENGREIDAFGTEDSQSLVTIVE